MKSESSDQREESMSINYRKDEGGEKFEEIFPLLRNVIFHDSDKKKKKKKKTKITRSLTDY